MTYAEILMRKGKRGAAAYVQVSTAIPLIKLLLKISFVPVLLYHWIRNLWIDLILGRMQLFKHGWANSKGTPTFECPSRLFIRSWKRYQQSRYHWLVSMACWWGNFLRRFLPKCTPVWQHCSMWSGLDCRFCCIQMPNLWNFSMYVPLQWMLQTAPNKSCRPWFQHV